MVMEARRRKKKWRGDRKRVVLIDLERRMYLLEGV